ncbi:hypothetical protein ACN6AT_36405 (plasmid) [Streptomyces sp. JL4002]|uniref:hypothetical protein n=1 Tax=Streptomyces sp. JL4002 TaxID=3404781 RepID=UPI003B282445
MPDLKVSKPAPGGSMIRPYGFDDGYGTLGATIEWCGRIVSVTCAHVAHAVGLEVFHPAQFVKHSYAVGTVHSISARTVYSSAEAYLESPDRTDSLFDFAVIEPEPGAVSYAIPGIYDGKSALRHRNPVLFEEVVFRGASGRVIEARVGSMREWGSASLPSYIKGGPAPLETFANSFHVEFKGSLRPTPGDSGSAIVARKDNRVVGLFTAGGEGDSVGSATRIPDNGDEMKRTQKGISLEMAKRLLGLD